MAYKSFEANYLISLLSSIFNKRIPPSPVRATDWRELFYLAEYHDITNIACYALIGLYDEVPEVWKDRFYKVFRKWVTVNSVQEKETRTILEVLEESGIDCMVMKGWLVKGYYPQADMRALEDVEVLIKPTDEKHIKMIMKKLGYHYEGNDDYGRMSFFKTLNFHIVFYQQLFQKNRKLRSYFLKIWKQAHPFGDYRFLHSLNVDDFYIYMIADVCDKYAKETIDARDIVDIHLFLEQYKTELNRTYIDTNLVSLELLQISKYLEEVGDLWFGVYEGTDPRGCRDVEEYIWSKGAYGRETSKKLLPMITDMEIWKIRDERREHISKILHWFFPKADYMVSAYPIIEKTTIVLPVCWILRLLRMVCYSIRIRAARVYRLLVLKNHKTSDKGALHAIESTLMKVDNTNKILEEGKNSSKGKYLPNHKNASKESSDVQGAFIKPIKERDQTPHETAQEPQDQNVPDSKSAPPKEKPDSAAGMLNRLFSDKN